MDSEKEIRDKYIAKSFGKHKLILKDDGKFVRKGYSLKRKDKGPIFPPPGNMPSPMGETKKCWYRTTGNWVYLKRDSMEFVVLKATNYTDTLFLLENGNLSANNPNVNEIISTVLNGKDTIYTIKNKAAWKEPAEYVKQNKN